LANELGAAQQTVKEEEGIQRSLQVAMKATSQIFEMDKQALIKKKLQVMHKGEPQPFQLLYETIQDFSNDIIAVGEGLQRKVVATREYLKEKYQPAVIPKEQPADGGKVMVTLEDSDEERVPGAFVRTLGLGRQTEKIPEDQPDSLKQLVAFKPLEEKEEPKPERCRTTLPCRLSRCQNHRLCWRRSTRTRWPSTQVLCHRAQ
jgi:hypothetical protein